jgi:uncharacterized membrane protein
VQFRACGSPAFRAAAAQVAPRIAHFVAQPSRRRRRSGKVRFIHYRRSPMDMSPVIAVHLTAVLGATGIGPVALWARKAGAHRPKLHRAAGYAWVTLMLVTATSAIFIRDYRLPNIAGYTPIHILIPVVYGMLFLAFWFLAKGNISGHRKTMQRLYIGACGVAGAFTLLPGRYLGNLVFGQ